MDSYTVKIKQRYVDITRDRLKPTCLIHGVGH